MDISHPPQAHRLPPPRYLQSSTAFDRRMIPGRSATSAPRSSTSGLSSSNPMSIPNARDDDFDVPPPLPPPRFISDIKPGADYNGGGSAYPWSACSPGGQQSWGKPSSVRSGSSLYGSFSGDGNGITDGLDMRRGGPAPTIKSISEINGHQNSYPRADEGYASLSTTGSMSSSYSKDERGASSRSGFQSSVHDRYRADTGDYDKGMLSRLDSRRGPDMSTSPRGYGRTAISRSLNEPANSSRSSRYMAQEAKPLSLPVRTRLHTESSLGWGGANGYPGPPPTDGTPYNFERRPPIDRDDMDRSPRPQSRQNGFDYDDGASSMGRSYYEADFAMEEAGGLQQLRIDDSLRPTDVYSPHSAAGQKRRASSPLVDEVPLPQTLHPTNSMSDLRRRRESAASRGSPAPSHQHSLHGSVSSTASGPRSGSFSGQILVASNNLTLVEPYGQRLSPGGLSPGGVSPRTVDGGSSFIPSFTVTNAPYEPHAVPVERVVAEVRPIASAKRQIESLSQSKSGVLKVQSGFVCDCCPKKPKKFETEESLNAHEAEKQYECAYCKNRFKNKNEAERHQNSLHLRRHSWSCAALSDYADAFHESLSSSPSGMVDTCGYCGDEFQRSGRPMHGSDSFSVTESDWNARVQHLVDVHKIRECNHTKKFFRADHFRQHLKHSHAGTSGKWTNMLENACMKDEPLPEPIRGPEIVRISSISGRVSRINEEDERLCAE